MVFLISYRNKTKPNSVFLGSLVPAVSGIFLVCVEPEWERNWVCLFICVNPVTIWLIAQKENLLSLSGRFVLVGHDSTGMHL